MCSIGVCIVVVHSIRLQKKFLETMNRPFTNSTLVQPNSLIVPRTIIRDGKPKISEDILDYSYFSEETKEYNFVMAVHGRICVGLANHLTPGQLGESIYF